MTALFLTSDRLDLPHGFSVRRGGVSQGPYASLNLGFSVGDDPGRVEENLGRLARAAGVAPAALRCASQVHGDRLLRVEGPSEGPVTEVVGEADGLWTSAPGVAVGVKTADCVPILIADAKAGRVAAVHSGWRGTALQIVRRAVETLQQEGSDPGALVAAIGPCIQRCCYEVSDELAQQFTERLGAQVVHRPAGRPHLDLALAVKTSLLAAGLTPDRIDVLGACTACDPERFFSHRRDRGVSGRHLSFIAASADGGPRGGGATRL